MTSLVTITATVQSSLAPSTVTGSPTLPSSTSPSVTIPTPVVATATHTPWYLKSNGEPSTIAYVVGIHVLVLIVIIVTICMVKCCCCRQQRRERREKRRAERLARRNGGTIGDSFIPFPGPAPNHESGQGGYYAVFEQERVHGNVAPMDQHPKYEELSPPPEYTAKTPKN